MNQIVLGIRTALLSINLLPREYPQLIAWAIIPYTAITALQRLFGSGIPYAGTWTFFLRLCIANISLAAATMYLFNIWSHEPKSFLSSFKEAFKFIPKLILLAAIITTSSYILLHILPHQAIIFLLSGLALDTLLIPFLINKQNITSAVTALAKGITKKFLYLGTAIISACALAALYGALILGAHKLSIWFLMPKWFWMPITPEFLQSIKKEYRNVMNIAHINILNIGSLAGFFIVASIPLLLGFIKNSFNNEPLPSAEKSLIRLTIETIATIIIVVTIAAGLAILMQFTPLRNYFVWVLDLHDIYGVK